MELVYIGDKTFLREPNQINITWRITRNCNFSCWYCCEHSNKRKNLSFEDSLKVVDFLSKLDKDFIRLNITGGEPTLYPRFMNLMAATLDSISPEIRLRLTLWTNLSANVQMYQNFYNLCSQYDNVESVIVPGFHKEFMKIEDFKEKYNSLRDYGIEKMLFTVYEDNCFEDVEKVVNYPCIVRAVHGKESIMENNIMDFGHFHYFREPVSIYHDNGKYYYSNSLETKNLHKYVCKSYVYNPLINDDGRVYACPRLFYSTVKSYSLLDEKETEELLKREDILCPLSECPCDWFVPKFGMKSYSKIKDSITLDFLKEIEEIEREGMELRAGIEI